ncbi:zinc finger protein 830 [Ambystoma mexicanum]|uniref:zinc finger protein 830 n=1 Tax=Ambystoma mexicanum TaxID=8296 RepID=UPI0037E8A03D
MAAPDQSLKGKPFTSSASSKKLAASSKKPVNQEELRRLMKEKQREKQRKSVEKKRIESPFVKYNSLDHISCTLCNTPIKNELLWQTHILGKQHKEKVAESKGVKPVIPGPVPIFTPSTSHVVKRKGPESESPEVKKAKVSGSPAQTTPSELPTDFFEKPGAAAPIVPTSKGPRLLATDYGDDDDDDETDEEEQEVKDNGDGTSNQVGSSSVAKSTDLPAPVQMNIDPAIPPDFFDSKTPPATKVSHSGSILKAEFQEKAVERKENTAEALPEGFFDDPEVDAKVRKVDAPKDQMDKEWDEFQKEMRQVNTVSEAIVAEEDEEGRLERQIEEIDEQMECYRRIEELRNRQDLMKGAFLNAMSSMASEGQDDQDSGSDDGELQVLLSQDWRVKGALL